MKICLLNTYDQTGGAARAAYRLLCGLRQEGVQAKILVRDRISHDADVIKCEPDWLGWCKGWLDILPTKRYPRRQRDNFSPALVQDRIGMTITRLKPDLLHLHWLSYGFLQIETLQKLDLPIVWTLHDSWPFTGGCHLPGSCRKYEGECGACPVLGSSKQDDLSRRVWRRKRLGYPAGRMVFVAPSRWMAGRARASSLLQDCTVEVIPNGIDVTHYCPGDSLAARDQLGLPRGRNVILFGAHHALSDRNKGFDLLCAALQQLPASLRTRSILVLFGERTATILPDTGIETVNCGEIANEETIVTLYRAADLLAVPSRQENLPNMISEAMACGTPCVAFDVGGVGDQISPRETGCLATPFEVGSFAAEVAWLCEDSDNRHNLAENARRHAVAHLALERVARQHLELYRRIIAGVFHYEAGGA